MSETDLQDYASFLFEVKGRIREHQLQALRSVNRELVSLYWDIGELIYLKQEVLDSPPPTYGLCGSFTMSMWTIQISNYWLEKLDGLNILCSLVTVGRTEKGDFTYCHLAKSATSGCRNKLKQGSEF